VPLGSHWNIARISRRQAYGPTSGHGLKDQDLPPDPLALPAGPGLDFVRDWPILAVMSVAELQKTIRGLSAEDRRALAMVAARMKRRKSPAHRRKLTAAMRAMDSGKKFTWNEVKTIRAERRKASDG
jgi:hypothetical protein